jgi:hypothetical protein
MLELYHGSTSVCAQNARLALAEKRLELEIHVMALNGDQLDPGCLKLNPNGAARLALLRTDVYSGLSRQQPSQHKR